jgi:hypothetical protein
MWTKNSIIKFLPYTILFITIFSILPYPSSFSNLIKVLDNFIVCVFLQMFILYVYWCSKRYFFHPWDSKNMVVVKYYLLWNTFEVLRGIYIAETYWDWKGLLINTLSLLVPIVAYTATNVNLTQKILQFYLKFALPFFLIIAFFISNDAYGFYLVPIGFLMLFLPLFNIRSKFVLIAFTIVVLTADFGARSNVIKFGMPIVLLVFYMYKNISIRFLEVVRKMLILTPILFFSLALMDVFNPFKIDEYLKGDFIEVSRNNKGEIISENLAADTRTSLYMEVLETASKYNSWFLGRSPARGNETELFASLEDITGRKERLANEVAILNIYTWTGVVGVILYLCVFYKASYLAVNASNNISSKILGIFIAFRWVYAWVEDINNFSLTNYFIWLMIGLCLSKSFRSMSDIEIKYWVRGIFDASFRGVIKKIEFK